MTINLFTEGSVEWSISEDVPLATVSTSSSDDCDDDDDDDDNGGTVFGACL